MSSTEAVEPMSPETEAPSAGGWLPATFRSLRHRNYRLYFLGQFVSITGSWMQTTALMWLAYERTGLSKWAGAISAAQILPIFFLGVWGGRLADRWPKHRLIIATQAASLLQALVLIGLVACHLDANPWWLFTVALAGGIINGIDLPARMAFVIEMVGKGDLVNAVALNSLLFNAARVAGPALAAPLLALGDHGPMICFLANALSYLAVLAGLCAMDPRRLNSGPADLPRQGLREGFRFLRSAALAESGAAQRCHVAVRLAGTDSFAGASVAAVGRRLVVVRRSRQRHRRGGDGGGLPGGVAHDDAPPRLVHRRRRAAGGAGHGLVIAGPSRRAGVAACGLVGCGLILYFVTTQAVTQLSAGDHNRGLIMGVWSMVLCGANPLGNLLAGGAADHWGVAPVLLVLALGAAVVGIAVVAVVREAVGTPVPERIEEAVPSEIEIVAAAQRFGMAAPNQEP